MPHAISVVIVTCLRPELLAKAIRSLCHQSISCDQYEIVIADNASDPGTKSLIQQLQAEYPEHTLTWLPISQNNVSIARNTALQQASSPLIACIDDDALASSDWLETGLHCFETIAVLDCLGGPILPYYTTKKPLWFKDQYETRKWGEQPRWLNYGEAFSGSNMIWRRSSLIRINGFDPKLGPSINAFSLGEDTSAFIHAWDNRSEPKFYYCPNLIVHHCVPAYKMDISYILRRAVASGQVPIRLKEPLSFPWRIKILIRSIGAVLVYSIQALGRRYRYPTRQNWAIEEGRRVADKVGAACAAAGIRINIHHQ